MSDPVPHGQPASEKPENSLASRDRQQREQKQVHGMAKEGWGGEADFSTTPFAKARMASVEMTVSGLWFKLATFGIVPTIFRK